MQQQMPPVCHCGCGSSNFKITNEGIACSYCGNNYSTTWTVRSVSPQAKPQCKCGSPIFSIAYPNILFCPNCSQNASGDWQLIPFQQPVQGVNIQQPPQVAPAQQQQTDNAGQ